MQGDPRLVETSYTVQDFSGFNFGIIWVIQFIVESILEAYMAPPVLYKLAAVVDRSRWTWFLDCFDISSKYGANMVSYSSFRGPISDVDLQFWCRCLVGVLPVLAFANWINVTDGESIALDYSWISDVLNCFVSNLLSRIEARVCWVSISEEAGRLNEMFALQWIFTELIGVHSHISGRGWK